MPHRGGMLPCPTAEACCHAPPRRHAAMPHRGGMLPCPTAEACCAMPRPALAPGHIPPMRAGGRLRVLSSNQIAACRGSPNIAYHGAAHCVQGVA